MTRETELTSSDAIRLSEENKALRAHIQESRREYEILKLRNSSLAKENWDLRELIGKRQVPPPFKGVSQ